MTTKPRKKPGGLRKDLTPEQIIHVEALASVLTQAQISDYLGISERTLRRRLWDDPDALAAYARGRARAIGGVAKNLLQQAQHGNFNAQKFYLETQAGWKATEVHEHVGKDGQPIRFEEATDAEIMTWLEQARNRLAALGVAGAPVPSGNGAKPRG